MHVLKIILVEKNQDFMQMKLMQARFYWLWWGASSIHLGCGGATNHGQGTHLVGDNSEFEFFSTFEGVLPSMGECWGQKLIDCPCFH